MSLGAFATAVVVPPLNLLPLGLAGLALWWRWPRFWLGLTWMSGGKRIFVPAKS